MFLCTYLCVRFSWLIFVFVCEGVIGASYQFACRLCLAENRATNTSGSSFFYSCLKSSVYKVTHYCATATRSYQGTECITGYPAPNNFIDLKSWRYTTLLNKPYLNPQGQEMIPKFASKRRDVMSLEGDNWKLSGYYWSDKSLGSQYFRGLFVQLHLQKKLYTIATKRSSTHQGRQQHLGLCSSWSCVCELKG